MTTKAETEKAFKEEFAALLKKYGAEITCENHWQGYAECGEDVRMTVTIPSTWDKDGNAIREWTEINLGRGFE